MTLKQRTILAVVGLSAMAVSAWADGGDVTIRTTAVLNGVAQRPMANELTIDYPPLSGHQLVNLARGRGLFDTNVPNEVLALNLGCDLTTGSLVVYDRNTASIVGVVASASRVASVSNLTTNDPLGAATGKTNDFVRLGLIMEIQNTGDATNGLIGGTLTVVGRIHADPETGCPIAVPLKLDRDVKDRTFAVKEPAKKLDKDTIGKTTVPETNRTGLATCMGIIDAVSEGLTNTIIVPLGNLSIRYDLPVQAAP